MAQPRCCVCGIGLDAGIGFARVNPVGVVPAVWACFSHTNQEKDEVIAIIEESNRAKEPKCKSE